MMNDDQETSELERHYAGAGKATHQGGHTANPDVVAKVVSDNNRAAGNAGRGSGSARRQSHSPQQQHVEDDDDDGIGRSFSSAVEISPVASLLLAGALGYALGWIAHGRRGPTHGEALPDYARKRA